MTYFVVVALALLVGAAIYITWRQRVRREELTKPADPVDVYFDALEDEAYIRTRTLMDAKEALRRSRRL
ncbi:hypothetical protein GTC6_05537 [Gordonia terrae C-6]|uniref:Uncharacterized protein n=1 Tax=Gordonia terrae C-6 TaxID=1316928 RepID=R7YDI3_9ACTN|nr:hypothetical protein [Gordonia terrae]EON33804.1 hypothetical protein GTC6_05537 [Gordonia terrae C-6]